MDRTQQTIDPYNVFALYSKACSYALQAKVNRSLVDIALDVLEKVTKLSDLHKEKAIGVLALSIYLIGGSMLKGIQQRT